MIEILIVDDEPSNLLALEAILEGVEAKLVRATTGKEALRHALNHEFAVVLLDVQMPEMDGFECAELLRSRPKTRDLPIIFLTAISKDEKYVQRGYGVGAVDYLFKPYEPDVLRSKVAVFVDLAKKNEIIRTQAEELRVAKERELADYKRWSEKRYADLADAMPQMVWTTSTDGKLQYANAQFRELGDGFAAIMHPEDHPKLLAGWQTAIASGLPWEDVLRIGAEKSGYRYHLVRAVPRRAADGSLLDWVGTSTDIDERVKADKSKDVFLATLSHELRTPLNAIVGWTDMMKNGQVPPAEQAHAMETIDRNAQALSGLVADLLDVSRIVTGALKLESKLVALGGVVESAVESARPQSSLKHVELDISVAAVGCVKGDSGRLKQIFGNLLGNAVKFTPSGGKVSVKVERVGSRARVHVKDSGEGIEPSFLPHVFERFRQAENAKHRGLGLGLAIVKYFVDEHAGTVTAESEGLGKGASFVVELPIAADEALAEPDSGLVQAQTTTPQLQGVRALVVEDDPDGNELITTILERYGAKVRSVGTAGDAIDAIDEEVPDILVSDIGLPDADGMELVRRVRARADCTHLPAIALTAYASRQDAAKAIAAGFNAHVAKPVQPSTLGATVARLIAARAAEKVKSPAA